MAGLAVNTTLGKQAEEAGRIAVTETLRRQGLEFVYTDPRSPSPVDGFVCRSGMVLAVAEIKTRDMNLRTLMEKFGGEWLITAQKVNDLIRLARFLKVYAIGYLYLPPENRIFQVYFCDATGKLTASLVPDNRVTRETVNGGLIRRNNYLISVKGARSFTYQPE